MYATHGLAPHHLVVEPRVTGAMTEREIRAKVRAVIDEIAPFDNNQLSSESTLVADLGFDSLGIFECVVAIEDAFGLRDTGGNDETWFETVGELEQYVLNAVRIDAETGAADV